MSGVLFLLLVVVWFALVLWMSRGLGKWLGGQRGRSLVALVTFSILAPLPLADELIGAWQFKGLCEEASQFKTEETRIKGKTVRIVVDPRHATVPYTAIPIQFSRYSYQDVRTGEELASYTEFDAGAGRLVHFLPILEKKVPLLIGRPWCGPLERGALPTTLGFTLA